LSAFITHSRYANGKLVAAEVSTAGTTSRDSIVDNIKGASLSTSSAAAYAANKRKPIIIALDYPTAELALAVTASLDPTLAQVKVGKELFTAAGPQVVEALMRQGFDVFLDLKYHDIPNTVAGACSVATRMGVWMLNVHAAGGRRMLEAAAEAVTRHVVVGRNKPILIAVTMLTSLSAAELPEIGLEADADAVVARYAALTKAAGLDGIVCSAKEAPAMKEKFGREFQLVTPGIRLPEDEKGDQSRVVTPQDAIKLGSDYLVIGRSITAAANPQAVLESIAASLSAG
jgi:orotidine-5'-phosphate decarboxylase